MNITNLIWVTRRMSVSAGVYVGLARRVDGQARSVPPDLRVRTVDDLVHAWCGMPLP